MDAKTLEQQIMEHGIELLSFDIFDTLLTRPCKKPTDVFVKMAAAFPEIPKSFPQNRIQAEQAARELAEGRECNIDEIYDVLERMEGYSPRLCKRLRLMEQETELRICMPRPEGAELLQAATSLDMRVVLISDMYLPKRHIGRMLCKCSITNFSELYVSCDVRHNKASGDMFRYVKKQEQMAFSQMLHIGDNPISDVIIPQNLGMHAMFLPLDKDAVLPAQTGLDRLLPHGTRRRKLASAMMRKMKNP
ncbi:MAG: hypothetical protein IJ265_11870 [Oscillospiraceae bacterium]|nr:hypothetical protein [Oscillospiraceae bacterium]MBQ8012242.1 hypothetical protein [Oscillospiraceae bacterium]